MSVLAWLGLTITLLVTTLMLFYETLSIWRTQISAHPADGSAGEFNVSVLVYFGVILTAGV